MVGEKFENETSTFYNDLYVFAPPHNRWIRYTSPSAPLPRSGHQMAVHPLTGNMYLFGGNKSLSNTVSNRKASSRVPRETHFIITTISINSIHRAVNSHEYKPLDQHPLRGQVTE